MPHQSKSIALNLTHYACIFVQSLKSKKSDNNSFATSIR
jgi:hypothetical protein